MKKHAPATLYNCMIGKHLSLMHVLYLISNVYMLLLLSKQATRVRVQEADLTPGSK
jgi:hypothetical protein